MKVDGDVEKLAWSPECFLAVRAPCLTSSPVGSMLSAAMSLSVEHRLLRQDAGGISPSGGREGGKEGRRERGKEGRREGGRRGVGQYPSHAVSALCVTEDDGQVFLGHVFLLSALLDVLPHLMGNPVVVQLLCLPVQLGRVLCDQMLFVLPGRPCDEQQ
ncbi:hypothetical protein EYF80_006566 [Liparis tanakae]|uniref:Uncharacterized protein n=1 Tax=Liparis tanakae TaxID=230148 RepID=A0A4Z2J1A7_9TELE|nr:hypothetical protein EYF80_006566 [Liparis tanakae]